jgi:serine protease
MVWTQGGEGGMTTRRFGLAAISVLIGGVAALGVAPAIAAPATTDAPATDSASFLDGTDQLIVELADPSAAPDDAAASREVGEHLRTQRAMRAGTYVMRLDSRRSRADVDRIAQRLARQPGVLSVEPDLIMHPTLEPNDEFWSQQWDLQATSASTYSANLPGAWDITTGATPVVVAVVDTGYRPHADLAGKFLPGYDFVANTSVANDGGGRDADASDPGDWITTAEAASGFFAGCQAGNSSWHGTHVSGTIAAIGNNSTGVAGINWGARILPVRVLGKCGGYTSDIVDGMRWAAGLAVSGVPANPNPAKVINLSLGGSGSCSATYQNAINAIVAAGTSVVVAAGNSNANASGFTPANCANVVTVAATGRTGSRAYYSNFGATVEIAAPGGDAQIGGTILSTLNAGTTVPASDSYANYQGTSMATPHVAGVISLMLSLNLSLTPAQRLALIQSTATPFPSGSSCNATTPCGPGILNAAAAVAAATPGAPPPPPPPPSAFSKTSPANGATNQPTSVTLSWGASTNASSYEYCIGVGACGPWTPVAAGTSVAVTGLSTSTTYTWQVRAGNASGTTQANGGTAWTFTTVPAPPGPFAKTSPVNGATGAGRQPTLRWASSSDATSYEYCLTTGSTCTSFTSIGNVTSVKVSGLRSGRTYRWQIRARNAAGTVLADGGLVWSFTA